LEKSKKTGSFDHAPVDNLSLMDFSEGLGDGIQRIDDDLPVSDGCAGLKSLGWVT